jgi:hypothetical protein
MIISKHGNTESKKTNYQSVCSVPESTPNQTVCRTSLKESRNDFFFHR